MNPPGLERALCFRDTLESLPVSVSTLLTPAVCVFCVSEQQAPLAHPAHGLTTLSPTGVKRPQDHVQLRCRGEGELGIDLRSVSHLRRSMNLGQQAR